MAVPRALATAVAAVAAMLALAACGGHAVTRKDVIARGNAICFKSLQSIRAVAPPSGGLTATPGLAAYAAKVQPILETEVSQLRSLPRPKLDQATLDRFIAAAAREATSYRELGAAAKRGDASGVQAAAAELRSNPAARYARAYGISECTGGGGTAS